jgi:hypothetical protein
MRSQNLSHHNGCLNNYSGQQQIIKLQESKLLNLRRRKNERMGRGSNATGEHVFTISHHKWSSLNQELCLAAEEDMMVNVSVTEDMEVSAALRMSCKHTGFTMLFTCTNIAKGVVDQIRITCQ